MEAIPTKKASDTLTGAEIGREYCDQLFKMEADLKDLSPEERFAKRLELEKTIQEAFWCWLENLNVLKGVVLAKAVTCVINQKKYMENYLRDGILFISNKAVENASCPFTIGRINGLFADTPKGATVYRIIRNY